MFVNAAFRLVKGANLGAILLQDLRVALEGVLADIESSGPPIGEASVRLVRSEGPASDAGWIAGLPRGAVRYVLAVGGSETAIDAGGVASATVEIAAFLQDQVIDARGVPWPDVRGLGVLDVGLFNEEPWWMKGAMPVARVGDLCSVSG